MANKRRADPAARPARRLRNDDRTPPTVPSTETIIRFYLHPSSSSLPTPLIGNVIAGGSFARPSEVLRLVSYLEGNIVRGLPGPVNRLLTLWDVEREEMTRPPRIPRHLLTRWTNIHRKVSWSTLVSWRQGICTLASFLFDRSMDGMGGFLLVEICECVFLESVLQVSCSCRLFPLSCKFENFINNVTVCTGRWDND